MRYIKPEYFDGFRCIADKCPDTCCAGWQIMIDDKAMEKYADVEDAFSDRLLKGIDWQEGSFIQYGGRCSMLNAQNLCDLVIHKGEDWLCETCSRYPRHEEEFEGLREWSLSLSCPVAAEMILDREEPMCFLEEVDEQEEPLEDEFEDFDFLLFTQLEDARRVLFSIVQNRELSMEQRLYTIMDMGREMQLCLDEERICDMEEIIREFATGTNSQPQSRGLRFNDLKEGFILLKSLERLREEWSEVLATAEETLYAGQEAAYNRIYEAFCKEYMDGGEKQRWWNVFREQIVMFFLYTYFCGAVYDDCIYSKVGMAVFSVIFIQEFIMCSWYLADKYIDKQECIRMAYRYAREVEHSDENLNLLEEWLLERM